jgi:hypothetical protein
MFGALTIECRQVWVNLKVVRSNLRARALKLSYNRPIGEVVQIMNL